MSAATDYSGVYAAIVDRLTDLRRQRDVSEARMLLAILDIESRAEEMKALELAGCENLERFVRRLEICDVARFRSFREGVVKLGREHALEMGAEATIEGSKTTNTESRERYVEANRAWIEQHSGVLPTRQTAQRIRRQVDPIREIPRSLRVKSDTEKAADRVAEFEGENARLRSQIGKLTKERDELKRRCVALSKELAEAKKRR